MRTRSATQAGHPTKAERGGAPGSRREEAQQRRIVAHRSGRALQGDRPAIDDIGMSAPPRSASSTCCSTSMTLISARQLASRSAISSMTPTQTPSVGSSSISSAACPARRGRSPASCARRPTASPPVWPSRCAELGEEIEHLVHARLSGWRAAAEQQVLAHRQLGEDGVLLRHVADAAPHPLLRRALAVDLRRRQAGCVPDIGGSSPTMRLQQRRLAGAVAARARRRRRWRGSIATGRTAPGCGHSRRTGRRPRGGCVRHGW